MTRGNLLGTPPANLASLAPLGGLAISGYFIGLLSTALAILKTMGTTGPLDSPPGSLGPHNNATHGSSVWGGSN